MSAQQSNLTQTGNDFVVATSLRSIDEAIYNYLALHGRGLPPILVYYTLDDDMPSPHFFRPADTDPQAVWSFFDLLPTGSHEFSPDQMPEITGLIGGFAAELGLPDLSVYKGHAPQWITPGNDGTLKLRCVHKSISAANITNGTAGVYDITADCQLPAGSTVSSSEDDLWTMDIIVPFFAQEPTDDPTWIQIAIDKANGLPQGVSYKLRTVFLDIQNATVDEDAIPPTALLQAVGPKLAELVARDYLAALKTSFTYVEAQGKGLAVNYVVLWDETDPSGNVKPVDFTLSAAPATLDYIFRSNQSSAITNTSFGWNWLEPGEDKIYDGVLAMQKKIVIDYFYACIKPQFQQLCLIPKVFDDSSHNSGCITLSFAGTDSNCHFEVKDQGNSFTMHFDFDYAHNQGFSDCGDVSVHNECHIDVTCAGDKITVRTRRNIWLRDGDYNGNLIANDYSVDYKLSCTPDGFLQVIPPNPLNLQVAMNPSYNGSNAGGSPRINGAEVLGSARDNKIDSTPVVSFAQLEKFLFPAGSSYNYVHAQFSDHGDLVVYLNLTKKK